MTQDITQDILPAMPLDSWILRRSQSDAATPVPKPQGGNVTFNFGEYGADKVTS